MEHQEKCEQNVVSDHQDHPVHACESKVGLIHGEDDHVEAEHEYHEDGGKLGKIAHEVAEDDGPRPEDPVEGEKVQDLHATHEDREPGKLKSEVRGLPSMTSALEGGRG